VHLLEWPVVPAVSLDGERWDALRALRAEVLAAIEPLRRDKTLGSSLEAQVTVAADAPQADLAELFISASVTRGDAIAVARTEAHKCGRCWRHLPEVTEDGDLCSRCDQVVSSMEVAE